MPRGRPPYKGRLTPREWEVLRLIEEGLTNEEIGERLGISFSGARYHVAEILSKLGVGSRHEAVAWAQEQQQEASRRPWAGIALLIQRLHLGSPAGIAAGGLVLAVAAAVLALVVLTSSDDAAGPDDAGETPITFIDHETGEAFLAGIPLTPEPAGAVLNMRTEVYERHGEKAPLIAALNGIPAEEFIRESWIQVGSDGDLERGVGRVSGASGEVFVESLYELGEDGVARTIEIRSGLKRESDPEAVGVLADYDVAARVQHYRWAIESGESIVVGMSDRELVLESFYDDAYLERTLPGGRVWTEEQKEERRDSFFQRSMDETTFAVPFYGDLQAVALIIRSQIDERGLETERHTSIRTEDGKTILVQRSKLTDYDWLDVIPPEVIAPFR